jgi:FAD/FMN-containing dehydrogenase
MMNSAMSPLLEELVSALGPQPFPEPEIDACVYGLVQEWGGSVSAKHGIGTHKKPYLGHSRNEEEIALMKTIKMALDPKGILNPGKLL